MEHDYIDALDAVSLEDLCNLGRIVSLESAASPTYTMDTKGRFGQFFKKADRFFSTMKLPALSITKLFSNDLDAVVGRLGYVNASDKSIVVPEGFIGQWLPYSALLNQSMSSATGMENMILAYNKVLGRLANDPSALESASGIGYAGPTNLGITQAMLTVGKEFFDGKSNNIHRTLGAVIERGGDIKATINNLNDAIAKDKWAPASKSLTAISRTMQLGETLMPYIDGNSKAAKASVQELITITLSLAKEMESYGVLLFRIRQLSESIKDSVNAIKK